MSRDPEAEFTRLTRWYPKQWRTEHGAVLIGTMMDAAADEGRTRPTRAERRSAVLHGLGTRLNARFALISAAAATVLGVLGLFAFIASLSGIAQMLFAAVPWLIALAAIAILRSSTAISGPSALAIAALATLAFALGFVTTLSWSIGFDLADEGRAGTWFSDTLLLWVTATWATGAAAITLLGDRLLAATRLPRAARLAVAFVGGLIVVPMIAAAVVSIFLQPLLALGMLILTLRMNTNTNANQANQPAVHPAASISAPAEAPPASPAPRRAGLILSWTACALSLLGLAYATTGSTWSAGGPDGTQAMRTGIAVMLGAGALLLVGIAIGTRGHGPVWRRTAPTLLIAAGFACASVGSLLATASAPWSHPTVFAAPVAIAIGVAALIIGGRRGTPAQRWMIGVGAGLIVAALALVLLPALAFTVPLIAAGFALARPRRVAPTHARATFTPA